MRSTVLAVLSLVLATSASAQDAAPSLPIIPAPVSVRSGSGHFTLTPSVVVRAAPSEAATAELLRARLREAWRTGALPAASSSGASGAITLTSRGSEGLPAEGYRLSIAPAGVTVIGRGAGLFYGVQSLLQLIPATPRGPVALPAVVIEDYPRFAYRGMHLDVSRHFFSVEEVKRYVDVMAAYKLNNFHWHLTDDNGWRVEIKRYPRLTQIGAFRAQTTIGHYFDRAPQWYDATRHGGFYTQDEIRDVVRYAAARHVNVVPEIEMPGHSTAALAAYPELGCEPDKPMRVAETFGIWTSVFCPTEATFTFIENVLSEVVDLFPSKYIHVGGDETPKDAWKRSAFAQQVIREKNLKDEHGLQSYFVRRIETFLNSKGRSIIGWDEILEGGLAPNATVMSWRGEEGGIAAARQRHDVIMASSRNHLYFNDRPTARTDVEALRATESLRELYTYDPVPSVLTADEAKHVKGVTGAIWTEYVRTPARLEYTLLPRMLALSELAWTPTARKDYARFAEVQLPRQLARLDAAGYEYRVPVALGPVDTIMQGARFTVALKPPVEGARIHYTIDGYPASETDELYAAPLTFDIPAGQQRELQTVVVTPTNRKSRVARTVMYNAPQPENNPFGVARALQFRLVKGPVADLATLERREEIVSDTASTFDPAPLRRHGASFGVAYWGEIALDLDGTYTFELTSAGPSRLLIDGRVVVDNPGGATETSRTGQVTVLRGLRQIRVLYAEERPGPLHLWVTAPGRSREPVEGSMLRGSIFGRGQTGIDAQ
jgi:hexosaminidase